MKYWELAQKLPTIGIETRDVLRRFAANQNLRDVGYNIVQTRGGFVLISSDDRGGFRQRMSSDPLPKPMFFGTEDEACDYIWSDLTRPEPPVHESTKTPELLAEQSWRMRQWLAERVSPPLGEGNGTVGVPNALEVGDEIERIGARGTDGSFAADPAAGFAELALPPDRLGPRFERTRYEVVKLLPPEVMQGWVTPWFAQPGGAVHFYFPCGVRWYVDNGYLRVIRPRVAGEDEKVGATTSQ